MTVRETAQAIAGDSWGPDPKTDLEIGDWILHKLSHASYIWPQPFNLNLVSHYSMSEGFKVSERHKDILLPIFSFEHGWSTVMVGVVCG